MSTSPSRLFEPEGKGKLRVLFLCVHNSARSQMAEGLLRALGGERFDVYSAGSEPTSVNPFAVRALRDEGIDTSHQRSKHVSEFANRHFDYVVTLCAEQECTLFLGDGIRLHWDLPDPAAVQGDSEDKVRAFARTAAELRERIRRFVIECDSAPVSRQVV